MTDLFTPGHRACAGCGAAIAFRQIVNALGKDIVIVNATGCGEIISTPFPESAWEVPYIHTLFENVPAVASGVVAALRAQGNDHTTVVCIAGDGSTYDIGFGALSGMLERNDDVLYICYDNEAYMNTGVQRSSSTPLHALTTTSEVGKALHGKEQFKKPLLDIVAAHRVPYAASTCIAYPFDVDKKLKKAKAIRGARFVSIFASCVTGWGVDTQLGVSIARLAVETGMWPMQEYENGEMKITMKPARKPVLEYFKLQRRFKHLTPEEVAEIQKTVDGFWAKHEAGEKK
ncbi:MAG: thiamine pyrophosphate-dependent enzyme [Candidatus Micrarchaeota archaeon]|nr:thiamine pyrophosphate-dependent enzyme [Candidatus Micrarchaeota archaeon]